MQLGRDKSVMRRSIDPSCAARLGLVGQDELCSSYVASRPGLSCACRLAQVGLAKLLHVNRLWPGYLSVGTRVIVFELNFCLNWCICWRIWNILVFYFSQLSLVPK